MIIRNLARCKKCKDTIESTEINTEIKCKCGKLVISGGVSGELYRFGEFDELSEVDHETKYWPW